MKNSTQMRAFFYRLGALVNEGLFGEEGEEAHAFTRGGYRGGGGCEDSHILVFGCMGSEDAFHHFPMLAARSPSTRPILLRVSGCFKLKTSGE